MKKAHKGFTLIELLVVIAIIGILIAIIVPNLTNARKKGRDARRISDLKSIQLALSIYYDNNRSSGYPTDIYALTGSISSTYIPVVPKDPLTNTNYRYSGSGTAGYCLGAVIEGTMPPDSVSCGFDPATTYMVKN